ncbi:MAG TPA: phosphotransferase [Solirubrobacteraceae bacterium]|nr:phosphotransferase [Solirubrobacteraceae bacterium]
MPTWTAELAVDADLARRLIGGQFPGLDVSSVERTGAGWDNSVWSVEGRWFFRFPQRAAAVAGVERELAVLPGLAGRLPLAIPVPRFVGRPAAGYPWPFFGGRLIPGREIAAADLTATARGRLARPLGRFLRVLHALGGPELERLPIDPIGRADMARRVPATRMRLAELERLGLWRAPDRVAGMLAAARGRGPAAAVGLVHGDLHVRHLLVGADGTPTGVIDWGDVCRGDPAIDLSLYWSLFEGAGRAAFLDEYGPVAEGPLLVARVLALFLNASLAVYAHDEAMGALERVALAGLERTVG